MKRISVEKQIRRLFTWSAMWFPTETLDNFCGILQKIYVLSCIIGILYLKTRNNTFGYIPCKHKHSLGIFSQSSLIFSCNLTSVYRGYSQNNISHIQVYNLASEKEYSPELPFRWTKSENLETMQGLLYILYKLSWKHTLGKNLTQK